MQPLKYLGRFNHLLWAKSQPFRPLAAHMMDAGCCVERFLKAPSSFGILRLLTDLLGCGADEAVSLAAFTAAVHDIGKAISFFQCKDEMLWNAWKKAANPSLEVSINLFRHEVYGEFVLRRIWDRQNMIADERLKGMLATAVRLHHQNKISRYYSDEEADPLWISLQDELNELLSEVFQPAFTAAHCRDYSAAGWLMTGLTILGDWVASSNEYDDLTFNGDLTAYLEASRRKAETTLAAFGITGQKSWKETPRFCDLWPAIPESGMRPVQRACEALQPGILTIIEAPMGEGKTEAALYLANRLCTAFGKAGIYMALPTSATSNQMYDRVHDMFSRQGVEGVRLLHAMAWCVDELTRDDQTFKGLEGLDAPREGKSRDKQEAAGWLRPLRRGLLSGNAVGTVDQAMKAVLLISYGVLRWVGLCNKVLIIDEIHAYDAYMSEIIARLLTWCRALSVPVILLSATMQDAQKRKYLGCYGVDETLEMKADYPMITTARPDGSVAQLGVIGVQMKRRYVFRLRCLGDDAESIARLALERSGDGGCLCVMLNTVKRAQEVYECIKKSSAPGTHLLLFHARFMAGRRLQIEQLCQGLYGKESVKRPSSGILVCTQVVEQSLDVDFDGMITEIAPIDLLLQRGGRVHRHMRQRPAHFRELVIDVVVPRDGPGRELKHHYGVNGVVYQPLVLKNTQEYLNAHPVIRMPEDIRESINAVYEHISPAPEDLEAYVTMATDLEMQTASAGSVTLPIPVQKKFFADLNLVWKMSLSEEDQGDFAAVSYAATRQGQDTVRVALLDEKLYQAALTQRVSPAEAKAIYLKSVGVSARKIAASRMRITKGLLKGLVPVLRNEADVYQLENYRFSYDDEYGVRDLTQTEVK